MQISVLKQRAFDKKWERLTLMPDPTEDVADWEGREMLFPLRWVVTDVYENKPDR